MPPHSSSDKANEMCIKVDRASIFYHFDSWLPRASVGKQARLDRPTPDWSTRYEDLLPHLRVRLDRSK